MHACVLCSVNMRAVRVDREQWTDMKKKLLTGLTSLSLLDGFTAFAADLPSPMPVKAPPVMSVLPPLWTGFYFGGHVGYSWGSVTGDTETEIRTPSTGPIFPHDLLVFSFDRDLKPRGVLGGIQAGYNYQFGASVIGVEVDVSWTGQRDTFNFQGRNVNPNGPTGSPTFEDYVYQETLRAKLAYVGTVRGRLGYAFGTFLPYVTGGFAWGRLNTDLSSSLTQFATGCVCGQIGPVLFAGSQGQTLVGGTVGAGLEYAFARQWSAKIEYLFVDLGKKTFYAGQSGSNFGMEDHLLRFGINFRL
jgi:outer membrane immunogenic protein